MVFLIKYKKLCYIDFFNLIKFLLFFLFLLYIKYREVFNYTLEKKFINLFDIYLYYNFNCFSKLTSIYVIYDSDLFFFLLKKKFFVLINSFFYPVFNEYQKISICNQFKFNIKKTSKKTLGYLNRLKLKNNRKNQNNKKLFLLCDAHRNYCFSKSIYNSEIKNNYIFDIHMYLNFNIKNNHIIVYDFLSSRYHHEILKLNQKLKMNFEVEEFLIQNNCILIMDLSKHKLFCQYFKSKFLFSDKNLTLLPIIQVKKYQKKYFFRDFYFSRSIPLDNFILTLDSFNLYVSCNYNLTRILSIMGNFQNDYSVFLYDPLIVFNQLLIYFFDYNFLSYNFDSHQNFEFFNLYLTQHSMKEFKIGFSNFNEINTFFFLNQLEQCVFENFIFVLIHIYSLFYRINFEIYLNFHLIEINNFILTVDSLIQMDKPREFSLFQFDLSKSKQVKEVCSGLIKRKNRLAFFIAFTFYLLPV